MDFLLNNLPWFVGLGVWLYLVILLISVVENIVVIGSFFPGTAFVVFVGILSAYKIIDLTDVFLYVTIGTIIGAEISYYFGTKGTGWFSDQNKYFNLKHLQQGKDFFEKYGDKSIFLGRFISPIRPMIPFVAGLSSMNHRRFSLWNILGSLAWAIPHILVGYFLGGALGLKRAMEIVIAATIVLFILFIIDLLWIKKRV